MPHLLPLVDQPDHLLPIDPPTPSPSPTPSTSSTSSSSSTTSTTSTSTSISSFPTPKPRLYHHNPPPPSISIPYKRLPHSRSKSLSSTPTSPFLSPSPSPRTLRPSPPFRTSSLPLLIPITPPPITPRFLTTPPTPTTPTSGTIGSGGRRGEMLLGMVNEPYSPITAPSTPRSRSPSVSSLETIEDEPVGEEEAEREVVKVVPVKGVVRSWVGDGSGASGNGSGEMGKRGSGGRKRWSVCGGERRGDFGLGTIWE